MLHIVLMLSFCVMYYDAYAGASYFGIRSQGQDTARELAGSTQEVYQYQPDLCEWYASVVSTLEYTNSFESDNLACCLFDCRCLSLFKPSTITISGSRVENRTETDWLADYFGLPSDFISTVHVSPQIQNTLINWSFFCGLSNWSKGFFVKGHLPLVSTKWSLEVCETVFDSGLIGYQEGYITDAALPRNALLDTFSEFITGLAVPQVNRGLQLQQAFLGNEITSTNAITFESLQCAKWADHLCKKTRKTSVADIHCAAGYELYHSERGLFAPYVAVVIPTGNRPTGEFFFEPIVGNGHHWELGGGLLANIAWKGCEEQRFGVYIEGVVTHLFKNTQCRVFDLIEGCNSRYMLALKLGQPVTNLFAHPNEAVEPDAIAPDAQFISTLSPVANLTKQRVRVSANVQTDITCMVSYVTTSGSCTFDVGYNFWLLSCENVELTDCTRCTNPLADGVTWALKGDSQVFGYTEISCTTAGTCPIVIEPAFGSIISLSPSQHCATIHAGLNNFVGPDPDQGGINGLRPTQNPGVDNAAFVQTAENVADALPILDRFIPGTGLPVQISNSPVFLTLKDLDIGSTRQKKMSHKVFGALSYRWQVCDKTYVPYMSLGAKVEIGRTEKTNCTDDIFVCSVNVDPFCSEPIKKKCSYCTLSEWGVWFKSGVSF